MIGGAARRLALLALWGALAPAAPVAAAVTLHLEANATFADAPMLDLNVANQGDRPAERVVPEVAFQHQRIAGEAAALAPGAQHDWRLALPVPPGPGTFAAITHVRFVEAGGLEGSVPLVVLVTTPAAQVSRVRTSLTTEPGAGYTNTRLLIDNADSRPVAGRVIVVLPDELRTEPESQAVQIAAGGQRIVPFAVESRSARAGAAYSVYALFEYEDDVTHHTVLAHTETTVPIGTSKRAVPLAIGGLALAGTLALLAVAWRRAAARA